MKGTAIVMTLAMIVAGVTAVPLSGVASQGSAIGTSHGVLQTPSDDANETPPGARLAGVVGAQEAEVRGEVETRAFGVAVERAESDEARARVVADQVDGLKERLTDLRERKRALQRAHRNGTITTATYVAELTELTARTESTRELANQTDAAARDLPPDVAENQGINVTAIGTLERDAANLTGPEVARIAQSIAGPNVGRLVAARPPTHARSGGNGSGGGPPGPPDSPGDAANDSVGTDPKETVTDVADTVSDIVENTTDDVENVTDGSENASDGPESSSAVDRAEVSIADAAARIDDAAVRIDESGVGVNATALATAEDALDDARADLEAARSALDDGSAERAHRLAERAIEHVERAEGLLDDALGDLGG